MRTVLKLLFILAVLLSFAPTATPSASAATCYGASCNGLNASATGCDAQVSSRGVYNAPRPPGGWGSGTSVQLEMLYSPICNTKWVKSTVVWSAISLNRAYLDGYYDLTVGDGQGIPVSYSKMLASNATTPTKGCAFVSFSGYVWYTCATFY
jgi:hypothetical protein